MHDELIIARRGRAGRITLNRPGALNALTHGMILGMTRVLLEWRADPGVALAVVDGAGDRAFCAGADIKALYALGKADDVAGAQRVLRDEYRLNRLIRDFGKPYVALIDGVTMGGGAGVSAHGTHVVATERTLWAMPETGIGLFPDVGMTWVLPRLPDRAGMWLGLTGARLDGASLRALGLATHVAPAAALADLTGALEEGGIGALAPFATAPADPLAARRAQISDAFGQDSPPAILAVLEGGDEWAHAQAAALRAASPLSVMLTFTALRRHAGTGFAEAQQAEMRLAAACLRGHDFYEGVRAQVVDKDRNPQWRPATLDCVSERDIVAAFAARPEDGDLDLAPGTP